MGTKERVLELFLENRGVFFSGEEIAKRLSCSRNAVWKAVNALRDGGYSIEAVTNRGYCLSTADDILSAAGIRKFLCAENADLEIEHFPVIGSTNTLLRERAENGAKEGTVIIADSQTGGRGRIGRSFFSPSGTGIYMSLLLRPAAYTAAQAARFTTMAAVAVCEAIEAVAGIDARIKWVNDIFIGGKKVCGILTEAAFGIEDGSLSYAVLGLGINVYRPDGDFPEDLQAIAGAVLDEHVPDAKNRLAAEILNRFMRLYADGSDAYAEEYRKRSLVTGKRINILYKNGTTPALALDIDNECRLIVQYDDGTKAVLGSGEISIRLS